MKTTLKLSIGVFFVSLAISSCSASAGVRTQRTNGRSSNAKALPPGQAKKITGEKKR